MLVLSRKVGERIIMSGGITITIVENRQGKIRVGIDAPREVQIHREEVYEEIYRKNAGASPAGRPDGQGPVSA